MRQVTVKRIYDPPRTQDGFRVLVDRLWPRGVSKERAAIDHWARDIAPSTELRKWYGHDPARWSEFQRRYRRELDGRMHMLRALAAMCGDRRMTLLFSARDAARNHAVVLKDLLEQI